MTTRGLDSVFWWRVPKTLVSLFLYFRDKYKNVEAEQTLTVTNLAAGGYKAKVLHCVEVGTFLLTKPLYGVILMATIKTGNVNVRARVMCGIWTEERSVGDTVDERAQGLDDYVCHDSLYTTSLTYVSLDGVYAFFETGASDVSVGDKAYFTIWLQAENLAGTPLSATVSAKSIRGLVGIGPLEPDPD